MIDLDRLVAVFCLVLFAILMIAIGVVIGEEHAPEVSTSQDSTTCTIHATHPASPDGRIIILVCPEDVP